MCSVCGCGNSDTREHSHAHAQHAHTGTHTDSSRIVEVEQDILARNSAHADTNRKWLKSRNILALNFVSSPGSGKTSLLARTIQELGKQHNIAVVEGDQQTDNDTQRIRAAGGRAIQINTGRACHLDAHMVGHAFDDLDPENDSVVFVENVGNLICPALFKLGEQATVAILSVTEGEDKPVKYPDVFANADLLLITKTDLLPYLDFEVEKCIDYAKRVNPKLETLEVSAKTGAGMENWYIWLEEQYRNR